MVSTSSITMQSLVKTVLRVPAVGAKIWCLYLFSIKHCIIVYGLISMQFTVRDIKKIPLQYFMDKNVDVHLYNFFSHIATEC